MKGLLSPGRLLAMIVKELIQMRRDRMTFAIMFGLPIVQILLFGFVINSDPRHLPTAALLADNGPEGRTLLQGLKNSTYFDFVRLVGTEQEGRSLLTRGEVQLSLISCRISVTICFGAINPPFCWKQMPLIRLRLQVEQGL